MTEAEWLVCDEPVRMLERLTGKSVRGGFGAEPQPPPSARKLRLFACACWRASKQGSTGFLEALLQLEELAEGKREVFTNLAEPYICATVDVSQLLHWLARDLWGAGDPMGPPTDKDVQRQKYAAHLLREIVGNPFRPVALPRKKCERCGGLPRGVRHPEGGRVTCPVCLGKLSVPDVTPTVLALAAHIYETRDFEACGPLADALEEAGCPEKVACPECGGDGIHKEVSGAKLVCRTCGNSRERPHTPGTGHIPSPILSHLRSGGPHARGCWAVNLVLGKE